MLWETRFGNHPLWALIDQLAEQLEGVETPSDVDLADSLDRLNWLVQTLKTHREGEDPRRYSPTMLDNVQRAIAGNVQNQVSQYLADPATYGANLRGAADAVDTVVDLMGNWPLLSPKGAAQAAGRAASAYVSATNSALKTLNADKASMQESLTDLQAIVKAEKEALTQLRSDFQENAEERADQAAQDVTDRYVGEALGSLDEIRRLLNDARSQKAALDEAATEGKNLVTAIGRKAVAEDYRQNARNKAIAGWIWDFAGLAVGATPLVLLLVHFFQVDPGTNTATSLTLTRIGISIAAVGLAGLCFSRGSANHKESRRAKRADIRLRTVHPFIVNQDPEIQEAILEGMADRIYLQGLLDERDGDHDDKMLDTYLARVRARRAERAAEE